MSMAEAWVVIALAGLGTFALRLSFIQLFDGGQVPRRISRALRFVPAAVLAALAAPAIVYGPEGFASDPTRLFAGLIAAGVAWWRRSVLLTLAVGMGALWLLKWLA